jgi:hypothetical protein
VRTTIEIADDVLDAVRERARREKRTAGEVLSELARSALVRGAAPIDRAEEESFYGFRPLPARGPAVSNELINRLRDHEPVD